MIETTVGIICRICVKESVFHSNIITEQLVNGTQLWHAINDLLQLDIELEDGYPQCICSECCIKISEFEVFKRTAHEGRAVLLYLKENNDIKLEVENADVGGFVPIQNEVYLVPVKTEEFDSLSVDSDPLQNEIKLEDVTANIEGFVPIPNEIYLVPVKREEFDSLPVDKDPLQVDIKTDPLQLDDGHELDLEVSSFPVCITESEVEVEPLGIKYQKENGIQKNILQVDKGSKYINKDNLYSNISKNVQIEIPQDDTFKVASASLINSNRSSASLNENVTKAANQGKNEEWTVKFRKGRISNYDGRNLINYNLRHGEGDHRGKSGNIDNIKKMEEDNVGTHRSMCRLLKCHDCGEEFSDEIDMLIHTKIHYGVCDNGCILSDSVTVASEDECEGLSEKMSFECNSCNKRFYRKGDLKIHISIHMGKGQNFINSDALIASKCIRTGEETYQCKFCPKSFINNGELKNHEKVHTDENPFYCKWCLKHFRSSYHLKRHERIHTGEKPYQCEFCLKKFSHSNTLKRHERVHTGEKPYQCEFCHKTFSDSGDLKRHELVHTGEKPFQCKFCPKKFNFNFSLKQHEMLHTGEQPFQCKSCQKKFSNSETLKRHDRVHTGEKPFQCLFCPKKFGHNGDLKRHEMVHTGVKPFQCKICPKKFSQSYSLKLHEKVHTNEKLFV